MNGYEYEVWCSKWLRTQGYKKISLTSRSHDQGIDIIAWHHHIKTGFQCKYYEKSVGNAAVQEAYSGAVYYDCDQAAVLTNASFTNSARQLAEKLNVELWEDIQPADTPAYLRFKRWLALILSVISVILFFYAVMHDNDSDRMMLVISAMLTCSGSLFSLFSDQRISPAVFSIALFLYPLFWMLGKRKMLLTAVLIIIMLMLEIINITASLKKRNEICRRREIEEIKVSISETAEQIGKKLAMLIEDELHSPVVLKKAEVIQKTTVLTYCSSRDLEDLALLEYSLNGLCLRENSGMKCEIISLKSKQFLVKLCAEISPE